MAELRTKLKAKQPRSCKKSHRFMLLFLLPLLVVLSMRIDRLQGARALLPTKAKTDGTESYGYMEVLLTTSSTMLAMKTCRRGVAFDHAIHTLNASSPRIINFFAINNELDMLEIRLLEYWDVVDLFVIVESDMSFSGRSKPLYLAPHLCTQRFAPYLSKLVHVVLDGSMRNSAEDAWAWEAKHRDMMHPVGGLLNLTSKDLVFSSDLDELPYAAQLKQGANIVWNSAGRNVTYPVVEFDLTMYYFSLYHKVPSEPWLHYAKIYPYGVAKVASFSAMRLRHDRCEGCTYPDTLIQTVHSVPDAGIHATYFFPLESLTTKLRSFSHSDHWEWGAGQTDQELVARVKQNLREDKGWFGVELAGQDPTQNLQLLPFKPAVRDKLILQSALLHTNQMSDSQ